MEKAYTDRSGEAAWNARIDAKLGLGIRNIHATDHDSDVEAFDHDRNRCVTLPLMLIFIFIADTLNVCGICKTIARINNVIKDKKHAMSCARNTQTPLGL